MSAKISIPVMLYNHNCSLVTKYFLISRDVTDGESGKEITVWGYVGRRDPVKIWFTDVANRQSCEIHDDYLFLNPLIILI